MLLLGLCNAVPEVNAFYVVYAVLVVVVVLAVAISVVVSAALAVCCASSNLICAAAAALLLLSHGGILSISAQEQFRVQQTLEIYAPSAKKSLHLQTEPYDLEKLNK